MTDNFANAMKMIIDHEGGYSDHPMDNGKKTIYGITQDEIQRFLKLDREPTEAEVRAFPLESAKQIYRQNYWDMLNIGDIKNETAQLLVFDQMVNRGRGGVIRTIVVTTGSPTQISTKSAVNAINAMNPKDFCFEFLKNSAKTYIAIVKRKPDQIVFLSGWMNRVFKLYDIVKKGF